MPYIVIENFNRGMDTRRMAASSTPGTLLNLKNAHITRGGEIEKRKAFVSRYSLPAGTKGMARDRDGLVVFGSGVDPGVPAGVTYQRLQHPSGSALDRVLSWDLYAGKLYVAAKFADGSVHHFYDGDRVPAWFDGHARGMFTVEETGTFAGVKTRTSFFLHKDGEDLRMRVFTTNPDDPEDPISLSGWVDAGPSVSPSTWAQDIETAVDANTGTTGVSASYSIVGGHLLSFTVDDELTNWNGNRLWVEVEQFGVLTMDINAQDGVQTCIGTSSCTNVFRLKSGVAGGASPYTYTWEIVDEGGATASLSDAAAAEPNLTVTAATVAGFARHPVTVRCTIQDSASNEVMQVRAFVSLHGDPSTSPGLPDANGNVAP